jgi:hypothetical protein
MQIIDGNTFFALTQTFEYVPFTQSEGWWAMNSAGNTENRFVFFADDLSKPQIACMGRTTRKFGLKMLSIEGECLLRENLTDSRIIRNFYREIAQTDSDIFEVNSSLKYNMLYEIGIREAGYLRPVGLFSTALTILFDLQKPIVYDKNWQKNLRKAGKYYLDFKAVSQPTEKDLSDYFTIHSQMRAHKKFGENWSLEMLKKLFLDKKFQLFLVENQEKERIAGLITFVRNNVATSIFSATSLEGRKKSASYFLFDKTFKACAKNGILHYDHGRISPAAHKKNDIFLFKDGAKGEYVQYCGEFSFYKKQIYRLLMYFVKKYLIKRVEV